MYGDFAFGDYESTTQVQVTQPIVPNNPAPAFAQSERLDHYFENSGNFMITVIEDSKRRFRFDDDIFNVCKLLDPNYVRSQNASTAATKISKLLKRYPHLKTQRTPSYSQSGGFCLS